MIFMRLPIPDFGTISPINDLPRPPPCRRLVPVVSSLSLHRTTIARRLAHNGMLAVSTRSLRRPTVARPEALVRVASPGQAQLQNFDLALIPIVGIRPRINHIKLDEHTRRLLLSPSVRIAHSELFLFITLFLRCYKLTPPPCIYTRLTQATQPT
jgi:transposase InsO family protein